MELSSLGGGLFDIGGLTLDAGPTGITLRVDRNLSGDGQMVHRFLSHSMELMRRLRHGEVSGAAIVSVQEILAQGNCPVCTGPLITRAVICSKCATPHHAECWKYFGGCAIFGCGAKRTR